MTVSWWLFSLLCQYSFVCLEMTVIISTLMLFLKHVAIHVYSSGQKKFPFLLLATPFRFFSVGILFLFTFPLHSVPISKLIHGIVNLQVH